MTYRQAMTGLLSLVFLAPGGLRADDKAPQASSGGSARTVIVRVPPDFVTVTKVDAEGGSLTARKVLLQSTTREVTVPVQRDGRVVQEKRTEAVQVPVLQELQLKMEQFRFINGQGDRIADRDGFRQARVGKVVLLCLDINGIEDSVRKTLAPEALILVPRQKAPAAAPEQVPPPRERNP